jgi:uncharacterized membrane protein YdbT with pleckstrin-like domain
MATENHVWTGTSSQIENLGIFLLCGLLSLTLFLIPIAAAIALWKYLVVKNQIYELSSQRLKMHSGVLNKKTDELELYRVKDTKFDQPFFLRLFSLANIHLVTTDGTTPLVIIKAIPDAQALREQIRTLVEERRDQKRVRVAEIE